MTALVRPGVQVNRVGTPAQLRAPFPYYGGKARHAAEVWRRFGNPAVYVEPFAGSLAVLLNRPVVGRREVVCDLDGHIANFWRAMQAAPEEVARWADYPTIHQDLTARHGWLIQWAKEVGPRLPEDAEFYDPKAAGWWAWGRSNWIGNGWCNENGLTNIDTRPDVKARCGINQGYGRRPSETGNRGCAAGVRDTSRPQVGRDRGVSVRVHDVRRMDTRPRVDGAAGVCAPRVDKRPRAGWNGAPGIGVMQGVGEGASRVGTGERLLPWFRALQERLARVIVLNRSWESAVTPSVLSDTPSSARGVPAIFLDPPYPADRRTSYIYGADDEGEAAGAAYAWALERGERYRIAFCCIPGQFELPAGWDEMRMRVGDSAGDVVMFSPACLASERRSLFGGSNG